MHFPLHPETPAEGRDMATFYAERGIDPEAAYARMKGLMDKEGLPYGRRSHSYGVTGVPTFVADRYGVVGCQPYEVLEQLVEKAGARRRV